MICALALLLADLLAWGLSFAFTSQGQLPYTSWFVLTGLWVFWSLFVRNRYFGRMPFWTELQSLLKSTVAFMMLGCIAGFLSGSTQVMWCYAYWGGALAVLLPLNRFLARKVLRMMNVWDRLAVIFGSGENASQAALALRSEPSMGYALKAFLIPQEAKHALPADAQQKAWPTSTKDFELLRQYQCVVALEANQCELRDQLIRQLSQHQVKRVSVIPAMRGVPLFGLQTTQFFSHEVLMIHVRNQLGKLVLRAMKRVFDVVGSFVLLLLLSPLFGFVAYKVSRDGGGHFLDMSV